MVWIMVLAVEAVRSNQDKYILNAKAIGCDDRMVGACERSSAKMVVFDLSYWRHSLIFLQFI